MANDSSTGGYLSPSSSPLEGQALVDFFQGWLVGITGLSGQNVRPRWQPEPPNIPAATVDWMAFGITGREVQTNAAIVHFSGYDQLRRHETLTILMTIYGPNADATVSTLREGLQIPQNLEPLQLQAMGLIDVGTAVVTSELVKMQWIYRVDLEIKVRRQLVYTYPILDLLHADGTLTTDEQTTYQINV